MMVFAIAISAQALRCDGIVLLTCYAHQPMTDAIVWLRPKPRPKPKPLPQTQPDESDVLRPIKRPRMTEATSETAATSQMATAATFINDAHRRLDALCQRTSSSSTATAATSQMALSLRDAAESAEYEATAAVDAHDDQMVACNPITATIVLRPAERVLARLTRHWGSMCTGERCHPVCFGS